MIIEKMKVPTKMEAEYWYMKLRAKNFYAKHRKYKGGHQVND